MRCFVALFVALAGLTYAAEANACSCVKLTPAEGFTSSYAVFTGEVIDIEKNRSTPFGGLEVTLRVKQLWKGDPAEEIKVHTAGSSAACGYGFVEGTTYLVYAVRDDADPLRVSLCSRTAPVERAKEDLDALGKPIHVFEGRKRGCSVSATVVGGSEIAGGLLFLIGLALGARRLI